MLDNQTFRPEIILAPLRGVTTVDYRNAFARHFSGVDSALTPFISTVSGNTVKPRLLKDIILDQNQLLPIVPQIIGKEPADMILLANTIYDYGYKEVNWNLGCPWKFVARKMRGSGLLAYPDKVDEILDQVMSAITGEFSVKVRLGRKSSEELRNLIPVLNKYPLKEVIIHPRTAIQMYDGSVDLDMFAEYLDILKHEVVYNGDITSCEYYSALTQRFPSVTRWMIGRGLVANPFLAMNIKGAPLPSKREYAKALYDFHADIFQQTKERLSGPGHILGRMKELWKYMAQSFVGSEKVLVRILRSKTVGEYEQRVDDFFKKFMC